VGPIHRIENHAQPVRQRVGDAEKFVCSSVKYKELFTTGGAIDTDPAESFIVDIIQQPWDRRGAITIVPIMVNGSVTHFEAIDKDGSTLKIDATSDQIEVVMQNRRVLGSQPNNRDRRRWVQGDREL
jgi:hypothetical protein